MAPRRQRRSSHPAHGSRWMACSNAREVHADIPALPYAGAQPSVSQYLHANWRSNWVFEIRETTIDAREV